MDHPSYTRRDLLRTGAGATAAVAAVAAGGSAAAQTDFGEWLSDVGNYDGTVADGTGRESVTVAVGAEGNGGAFAFSPPAVKVDPGTTVRWEWTGGGGQHNVVDDGGSFESDLVEEAGSTYDRTFEEEGVVRYYCTPHRGLGMKGVVVVGTDTEATGSLPTPDDSGQGGDGSDGAGGGDGEGEGGSEGGGDAGGDGLGPGDTALRTFAAMVVLGALSPLLFALFLRSRGED